ncbi:putative membrane protein [Mucilaginibacter sp. UYP25]|uniref:hypothetical protein n=1 Tax=unclassified Mucilaginibacter TaxID=2617802 RepID=UPI003397E6C1
MHKPKSDYKINIAAKEEIEELMARLDNIELKKLDKIISILEEMEENRTKAFAK